MIIYKPVSCLVWKFCRDLSKVISGGNWLFRWNCVFLRWDFVRLCKLWLKAKAMFYFPNCLYYCIWYMVCNHFVHSRSFCLYDNFISILEANVNSQKIAKILVFLNFFSLAFFFQFGCINYYWQNCTIHKWFPIPKLCCKSYWIWWGAEPLHLCWWWYRRRYWIAVRL